jgi:hypothetical protein
MKSEADSAEVAHIICAGEIPLPTFTGALPVAAVCTSASAVYALCSQVVALEALPAVRFTREPIFGVLVIADDVSETRTCKRELCRRLIAGEGTSVMLIAPVVVAAA